MALTIDNILEVDMVLADGSCVTANAKENEDLFWAIRGGGGNFGIITSFLISGTSCPYQLCRTNPVAYR